MSVAACLVLSSLTAFGGFDGFEPLGCRGGDEAAPSVTALRVEPGAVRLDGRLDEPAWREAEPACGFRKWDPDRGGEPSEPTVFKVLYDDHAVYFGIACHETDGSMVSGRLCRRDQIDDSDILSIYVDPYLDRTTGYNFRVNPCGIQGERTVAGDGNSMDRDWNAVWDVETWQDENGWYAEFRIPFSCVRYRHVEDMTWGLNVYRFMHRRGEDTSWATWDLETRGFVSRFGELRGLRNVPPARRIEVVPYAAGSVSEPDLTQNIGADVTTALTANLTLNASLQPDYGQVEADPALLNLSPFETYYDEKRPFFIEGRQYFQHPGFNVFYSRRIGTGDETSRIRYAAKTTGRIGDWTVGGLFAETDQMTGSSRLQFRREGENVVRYGVARVGRDFADGAHSVNIMQTAVLHDDGFEDDEGVMDHREAFTTGADVDLNLHDRDYNIRATFVGSSVDPAPDPDEPAAQHERTFGTGGTLDIRKLGGTWIGGMSGRWKTEDLDLNDVGFLSAPDEARVGAWLMYQMTGDREGAVFDQGNIELEASRGWLYAANSGDVYGTDETAWSYGRGQPVGDSVELDGWGRFRNRWSCHWGGSMEIDQVSKYETRTYDGERGPLMTIPNTTFVWAGFDTDWRKPLAIWSHSHYGWTDAGSWNAFGELGGRWTPTSNLTLRLSGSYQKRHAEAQHLDNFENAGGGIGGVSYVFGELDQRTVDMTFRAEVLFSRDLSLQLYAQPYMTVGDYSNAKELARPESYDFEDASGVLAANDLDVTDFDFRYASVNVNAVLRWDYAPGSSFYIVWKQSREAYDQRADFRDPPRPFDNDLDPDALFDPEPGNVLLAKVTYWLPI
jgi:hypothetical protein